MRARSRAASPSPPARSAPQPSPELLPQPVGGQRPVPVGDVVAHVATLVEEHELAVLRFFRLSPRLLPRDQPVVPPRDREERLVDQRRGLVELELRRFRATLLL